MTRWACRQPTVVPGQPGWRFSRRRTCWHRLFQPCLWCAGTQWPLACKRKAAADACRHAPQPRGRRPQPRPRAGSPEPPCGCHRVRFLEGSRPARPSPRISMPSALLCAAYSGCLRFVNRGRGFWQRGARLGKTGTETAEKKPAGSARVGWDVRPRDPTGFPRLLRAGQARPRAQA